MSDDIKNTNLTPQSRILGYDVARGFAILIMFFINFKLAMGAADKGHAWFLTIINSLDGRAVSCFIILAGISFTLRFQKFKGLNDPLLIAHTKMNLYKRSLFLFITGYLFAWVWEADILHYYGLYFALGTLVIHKSNRFLLSLAGCVTLCFLILASILDYETAWNFKAMTYADFWTVKGAIRNTFYNGYHPIFPWFAFMLIGMVLGRCDLAAPENQRKMVIWGLSLFLFSEIESDVAGYLLSGQPENSDLIYCFKTGPMPPMPLFITSGTGLSLVIIAFSIEIARRFQNRIWLKALASTGRMTLTLYIAHVFVGMGVLEAAGKLENQTARFATSSALIFGFLSIIGSYLWLKHFKFGPFEWIMRNVTDRVYFTKRN